MKKILLLLLLIFSVSIHADRAYQKGLKAYQSKQYSAALKYFYISARHYNINAYTELGLMHEYGIGTASNLATAFYWYEKAANRNSPLAQYHLATMYEKGKWVKKDMKKAQFWYQNAAQNGNKKAKIRLAGKQSATPTVQPTVQKEQAGIMNSLTFWKGKQSATTTQPTVQLEEKRSTTATAQPTLQAEKPLTAPTAQKEQTGIMNSLTFWK
ncbi:MAG: tetratricopeptide repeat protein [Campylobacterota bacterium]|nr:tetratricopeptide repeat protein [Campylobacterota bacterium]